MVCNAVPGVGGLGLAASFALDALTTIASVDAVGPPLYGTQGEGLRWHSPALSLPAGFRRYTPFRWAPGRFQAIQDRVLGALARRVLLRMEVIGCYAFTQVALELLEMCSDRGISSVLDSPNGHVRNFRRVIDLEAASLLGVADTGPPTDSMVQRIEQEYKLAKVIRVASVWAQASLVEHGVERDKIRVWDYAVDLERFQPGPVRRRSGRLRVCYVGSVDLRKGIVYLLRSLRPLFREVSLRVVGATGSRPMARLIQREAEGLDMVMAASDPRTAYQDADLFVLPSLEDGFGYVVAEAMASGLPVIVTNQCGAAEWVTEGRNGWIVPARSPEAITEVLLKALAKRTGLEEMGRDARLAVVDRMNRRPQAAFARWLEGVFGADS